MGAKEIITERCKALHINNLPSLLSISEPTFKKRLEDPLSFTIRDINQICVILQLDEEEEKTLKGFEEYEEWSKKVV